MLTDAQVAMILATRRSQFSEPRKKQADVVTLAATLGICAAGTVEFQWVW
jgi:hypothetical protein